jgi:hypothetical protein
MITGTTRSDDQNLKFHIAGLVNSRPAVDRVVAAILGEGVYFYGAYGGRDRWTEHCHSVTCHIEKFFVYIAYKDEAARRKDEGGLVMSAGASSNPMAEASKLVRMLKDGQYGHVYVVSAYAKPPATWLPISPSMPGLPKKLKLEITPRLGLVPDHRTDSVTADGVMGIVSYALKSTFHGNVVTDCSVDKSGDFVFEIDSSQQNSEHDDLGLALATAVHFLHNGTPTRTTNRAGAETKGTRLVEAPYTNLKGSKITWSYTNE